MVRGWLRVDFGLNLLFDAADEGMEHGNELIRGNESDYSPEGLKCRLIRAEQKRIGELGSGC